MHPQKKIMLVDDDALFLSLTKKSITGTPTDTELIEFNTGKDAMNFLECNMNNADMLPDIILLDLNMPVMDGWGFLKEIEILFPFLRKLPELYVLSSSISPHDVARVKSISFVKDYYVKPLTREQFTWLINYGEQVCS